MHEIDYPLTNYHLDPHAPLRLVIARNDRDYDDGDDYEGSDRLVTLTTQDRSEGVWTWEMETPDVTARVVHAFDTQDSVFVELIDELVRHLVHRCTHIIHRLKTVADTPIARRTKDQQTRETVSHLDRLPSKPTMEQLERKAVERKSVV